MRRSLLLAACALVGCTHLQRQQFADERAIRAGRARSNAAIAAHDTAALAANWLPEFVLISSTNAQAVGREAARLRYGRTFADRPDVIYVRRPDSVVVNTKWGQAAEYGQWTGKWTQADGVTRLRGVYFAKWRRTDGRWLMLSEVYVQTDCRGSGYCTTPP